MPIKLLKFGYSLFQVFDRIKAIANADLVGKVKACYVFEVEGEGTKYYIDFKEGDGQVGEGEVPNKPADFKPEVKITMKQENMLKMFNSTSHNYPCSIKFLY